MTFTTSELTQAEVHGLKKTQAAIDEATTIIESVYQREKSAKTPEERQKLQDQIAELRTAKAAAERHVADLVATDRAVKASAAAGSLAIEGVPGGPGPMPDHVHVLGTSGVTGARAGREWAKSAVGHLTKNGTKSVLSASDASVALNFVTTPITGYPTNPVRIIDLISFRRVDMTDGPAFNYFRQTARTNNATAVADGGLKPTSVYSLENVEDRLRVVAHLSEPIPERFVADYRSLTDFMELEMREGLLAGLEAQVVSGDATGENMTGILNTSGLSTTPFNSDMLTTLRSARTQMEVLGESPTAWVLNPSDRESIDLLKTADGEFLVEQGALQNVFGQIPIVSSNSIAAGTALLGDFRTCEVVQKENVDLQVDRSGDLFDRNQLKMRVEGRFCLAMLRPRAITSIALTGA